MKSSCLAHFSLVCCGAHACEVIIQSPAKCGEPPFPMKNKNNLNVSLSLIGFFQKIQWPFRQRVESVTIYDIQ